VSAPLNPRVSPGHAPPGGSLAPEATPSHALGPDEAARRRERIIDVLWGLQQERGWIDDDAVRVAAATCGLTPLEVDEIATFYNLLLRTPAGRTPIFVCDSISCELNGASRLIRGLSERLGIGLGEVTADGALGLLPIVCLGHCERAPCLLAGETVHGPCPVEGEGLDRLIQEIRRGSGPARRTS
jgi:NADH-quinone oxidoreductase subunit E